MLQFPVFAFNEVDAEQPPNFDYLLHNEEAVAAELAAAQQMQPGVAAALKDLQVGLASHHATHATW